jgi:hypothetical protein
MAVGVPGVVGVCSAVVVLAVGTQHHGVSPHRGEVAIPEELAGYSHFTGSVSDSPPGAAVALYQHGFGVEFLDFPQAVVLGAGGDVYRRVDAAEDRAGAETQGDPAPMLLSPDGTTVAVGDHDIDQPDVVIVDLVTGATTHHPLPTGRSVVPIAWSSDGRRLAHLLSPAPTNPHSGGRIVGDIGVLDLDDGDTTLLQDDRASAAAFSPDGSELALQQDGDDGELSLVDLASGSRRAIEAEGVLAGPAAWSPDGRLLAMTTLRSAGAPPGVSAPGMPTGLSFVDPTGRGGDAPAPLDLSLSPQGHVLGWSGPDEVLTLLPAPGADPCCGPDAYNLSAVPLGGGQPRALMHISGLQSFGVARFQLAAATVDDLRVVTPADVDRGDWPLPLRGGLAILVGLVAWGVARAVLRRTRTLSRSRQDDQAQVRDQHALTGS